MSGAAPLRARAITVTRGPVVVLDSVDLTVAGRRHDRPDRTEWRRQDDAPARARRRDPARPGHGRAHATVRHRRLPAPGTAPRAAELVRPTTSTAEPVRRGASAELDAATASLAAGDDGADTRYDVALTRWLSLGVADLPSRLGEVWSELSLHPDLLDQSISSLSGGEAARVGLASLLLSRFDVYLLDEPTNDLDLDGLAMLERWIDDLRAGVVLVSHDRTFLASTVDQRAGDRRVHPPGNAVPRWLAGLPRRAGGRRTPCVGAVRGVRRAAVDRSPGEPSASGSGRARARPRCAGRARTTSTSVHFRINQTEQLAGKAARTEKAIERLDAVDKPRVPWQLRLDIPTAARSGDVVARLTGVVVDVSRPTSRWGRSICS